MHKIKLAFIVISCTIMVSQSWAYDLTFSCHHFEPYVTVNDKQEPETWFAALTPDGCAMARALIEEHTQRLTLAFDTLQAEQNAIFERLENLPADDAAP